MLRLGMHPEQATTPAGDAMPRAAKRRHMRLVLVRRLTRNAAIVTGLILTALFVGLAALAVLVKKPAAPAGAGGGH